VRLTRRATIWQKTSDGWKILYHQGTIAQEGRREFLESDPAGR